MKTKIILLMIAAVITLSFSFSAGSKSVNTRKTLQSPDRTTEPIGGFAAEEVVR